MLNVDLFRRNAVKLPPYQPQLQHMQADTLYSTIWYYTPQPQYIVLLAQEIAHNVINAHKTKSGVYNFICIHHHKYTSGNKEIDVPAKVISAIVEDKVKAMKKVGSSFDTSVAGVYIAAPQSTQESTEEIRSELANANIKVFTGADILTIWAKEHFGRDDWLPDSLCSLVSDYKQDVLTMVEMQLCMDSAVFIRSVASSWAANVQTHRIPTSYSNLDDDFADILEKIQSHDKAKNHQ